MTSFLAPDQTTATFSLSNVMSTSLNKSANLSTEDEDAMNSGLANEILRQLGALNTKVDDVRESLEEKIDRVEEQISGEDGLRDRVKSLEVATQSMVDKENTPITIHHTSSKKEKLSKKENATLVAGGAGGGLLLMQLFESLPKLIEWITK